MTLSVAELGYWLVSLPGIAPGDDVRAAIEATLPPRYDVERHPLQLSVEDESAWLGFDELIASQSPYAPTWHTADRSNQNSLAGFVVVAPIANEATQHASLGVLALMARMMQNGLTILSGPLTADEASSQWGDVRRSR